MITTLVFDFGGVMTSCTTPDRVKDITTRHGIPWQAVLDGIKNHRHAYDRGDITVGELYARTWRDAGITVDDATEREIEAADTTSFLYRNEQTFVWMASLKQRGFRIGILTNMPHELAPKFKVHFADFIALASATVISSEEHLVKPHRDIFDLTRERLGVAADEICFFDDVLENCRGAEAAGWHAIQFKNVADAAAKLKDLLA